MIFVLMVSVPEPNLLLHLERYQNQIEELQAQLDFLIAENHRLKAMNRELQWRVDPFSIDGDAICNSD